MALLTNNKQIGHQNKLGDLEIDQDIWDMDGVSAGWENVIYLINYTSSHNRDQSKFQMD